jgi:hypothetical protein
MATKPVYEVESMDMTVMESNPPIVRLKASGTTRTGGWTNAQLVQIIHVAPPKDGMIELSFVADEPTGASPAAITPIESAELKLGLVPEGTNGVRIIAETNQIEEKF